MIADDLSYENLYHLMQTMKVLLNSEKIQAILAEEL